MRGKIQVLCFVLSLAALASDDGAAQGASGPAQTLSDSPLTGLVVLDSRTNANVPKVYSGFDKTGGSEVGPREFFVSPDGRYFLIQGSSADYPNPIRIFDSGFKPAASIDPEAFGIGSILRFDEDYLVFRAEGDELAVGLLAWRKGRLAAEARLAIPDVEISLLRAEKSDNLYRIAVYHAGDRKTLISLDAGGGEGESVESQGAEVVLEAQTEQYGAPLDTVFRVTGKDGLARAIAPIAYGKAGATKAWIGYWNKDHASASSWKNGEYYLIKERSGKRTVYPLTGGDIFLLYEPKMGMTPQGDIYVLYCDNKLRIRIDRLKG